MSMPALIHPDICGSDWQVNFRKEHDAIVSGTAPREKRKYVVAVPVRAGGADNMLGIMSLFLYALLTHRAFLHIKLQEEGYHAPIIEHAYKPATFNWVAPEIRSNLSFCLWPPYDGTMSKRHCDTKAQHFLPTDRHDSTIFPYFMVNSFQQERFWHGNYDNIFGEDSKKDVHLIASNRGNVYMTFFNPHHNTTLAQLGFHKESAFACIYQYLFQSKREVCQGGCLTTMERIRHIQKHRKLVNDPQKDGFSVWSTMIFSIQIRDLAIHPDNVWFHCANALVAEYKSRFGVQDVYFILINGQVSVQRIALEKYGDHLLFPAGEILKENVADVLGESEAPNANSPAKVRAVMESARDWDVMSEADIHVVSSRSGFGVMGAMMRVRHPGDYRLYHVRDTFRQCTINKPDDLRVYADQWSGL